MHEDTRRTIVNISYNCFSYRRKSYHVHDDMVWRHPLTEQSRISQCDTAVLHCCKGDAASQWEMTILGVSELRNPEQID